MSGAKPYCAVCKHFLGFCRDHYSPNCTHPDLKKFDRVDGPYCPDVSSGSSDRASTLKRCDQIGGFTPNPSKGKSWWQSVIGVILGEGKE